MKIKGFVLYKIWYGNVCVYLGRTKQPLQDRVRGHIFKKPMHRAIDAQSVTLIEYALFKSEADMFLYEVYYINVLKPVFNIDDKARDALTVTIPDVPFEPYLCRHWEKWCHLIYEKDAEHTERAILYEAREKAKRDLRAWRARQNIDHDIYYGWLNELDAIRDLEALCAFLEKTKFNEADI